MKKIITFLKEKVFNKKGMQLIEMLIIVAIVATIAITTIPSLNGKVNGTLENSMKKIDNMNSEIPAE